MSHSEILGELAERVIEADQKYGPIKSAHEGYGLMAEEMMELLMAIHRGDIDDVRREADDVATVAIRLRKWQP